MSVTIHPDNVARDLARSGGDLSRRAIEEYKGGRLSKPAIRELLGLPIRDQLDGFLKSHKVIEDLPTVDDLERERQDLLTLGL